MSEPTLDQRRADHAYRRVKLVKRGPKADQKDFKIQVKKLPARIVTSGLGQALAFLEAKASAPDLRAGLADWIEECGLVGFAPPADRLLLRVIKGDSDFLRFATAECLAYLQWLVRFTEAEFQDI
jgi:CRISPR-associated protein Cmr5